MIFVPPLDCFGDWATPKEPRRDFFSPSAYLLPTPSKVEPQRRKRRLRPVCDEWSGEFQPNNGTGR